MRRTFFVRAIWDDEAQVYVSESDIKGLHIETKTLDEFKEVLEDVAVYLLGNLGLTDLVKPDCHTIMEF